MKEKIKYYWETPSKKEKTSEKEAPNVVFEVPGFRKDEIKVHLSGSSLTISASKKSHQVQQGKNFYREEAAASSFTKSLSLPPSFDSRDLEIAITDGAVAIRKKKKNAKEIV